MPEQTREECGQLEIKVWIRDKNSGPSSNRHLSIVGNQSLTRSCFQTLRPWSRVVYNIFFPCVGEHYFPKLSRDGQNRNFRESPKDRKISTNLKNEYRLHSGGLEFPWFQLKSQNAHSNDTLELLSFHEHAENEHFSKIKKKKTYRKPGKWGQIHNWVVFYDNSGGFLYSVVEILSKR